MQRSIILLWLMSRVYSAVTIQRHIYSHQISRLARSDSPPSISGSSYSVKPIIYDNAHSDHSNYADQSSYAVTDSIESKSAEKLGNDLPYDTGLTGSPKIVTENYISQSFTPMSNYDYKRPRHIDSMPSDVITGLSVEKLKYPSKFMNDVFYGYDVDFHNDEDDVRTSGKNSYDNYASFFYHNPYGYDNNIDMDKAKDKRYADISEKVIPVHEHIENDTFSSPSYESSTVPTDNPIGGHGPFFSFVLNDYFDRNHDEDTLSFKGLGVDWGKDFDHESYRPVEETRRGRRLESDYYTPVGQWLTTVKPFNRFNVRNSNAVSDSPEGYQNSIDQSVTDEGQNRNYEFDKHNSGENKHSSHKKSDGSVVHKYEGFKDFLDSFANKFGSAETKGDSNYIHEVNKDQGEKKKGFHRVYHKDEFLEDKEFFDNNNIGTKAADKASTKYIFGGSEALLRSQALGAQKHAENASNAFKSANDEKYENAKRGGLNSLDNKFDKYINVAKQAARSNSADYVDHFHV